VKDFFIVAGFQRSGSTFLSKLLNSHPQILMNNPVNPEPKFFIKSNITASELQDYLSYYFNQSYVNMVLGDKSVSYIEREEAFKNYKKLFPQGKLILILRNPVDRAISNYKFSLSNRLETRTMDEAFLTEAPIPKLKMPVSVSPFDYLPRGRYLRYIKIAYKYFDKNEVLFFCLEDLLYDINSINKIESFLNINQHDFGSFDGGKKVSQSEDNMPVSDSIVSMLIDYYKNDLEELKNLTGLELKHWNFD